MSQNITKCSLIIICERKFLKIMKASLGSHVTRGKCLLLIIINSSKTLPDLIMLIEKTDYKTKIIDTEMLERHQN